MKKILCTLGFCLFINSLFAQVSGNINYQTQVRFPENNINVSLPGNSDLIISVKGLNNLKADTYVAIFNLTQVGKNTEEVNSILDNRVNEVLNKLKGKEGLETYLDMISFVPVYEYEVEKKIFSKKTYHEIPAGFELKKNLHIKYKNPGMLNEIIAVCAAAEIYDLVRVDYFSGKLEQAKAELAARSKILIKEKMANYQSLLGTDLNAFEKQLANDFRVIYPVEMYRSYQAYSSSSLNLKKSANVNQADKSTTLYYQPIMDKEFDFVINPTILEPVIQVLYEIKIKVSREKDGKTKAEKEYLLITPGGEIKNLNIQK